MNNNPDDRQLARLLISKEKWWDILSRFIHVLKINLYIVDCDGHVILPPEQGKYGANLLNNPRLGFNFPFNSPNLMNKFKEQDSHLESQHCFDLRSIALAIKLSNEKTIAYMIVGPVILNRRLERAQYLEMAGKLGVDAEEIVDELGEIRVVSHIMLNSIIELLVEIVKNNIEVSERKNSESKITSEQSALSAEMKKSAEEIYSQVKIDELLVTLLDAAMKMTNTECGSIMMVDREKGSLEIKAAHGIDSKAMNKRVKIGEGIAGIAVSESETFVINGLEGDSRIAHLLKRPEIKHALVMPLSAKNRIIGVMNLSSRKEESRIGNNINNLKYLTNLLATAF